MIGGRNVAESEAMPEGWCLSTEPPSRSNFASEPAEGAAVGAVEVPPLIAEAYALTALLVAGVPVGKAEYHASVEGPLGASVVITINVVFGQLNAGAGPAPPAPAMSKLVDTVSGVERVFVDGMHWRHLPRNGQTLTDEAGPIFYIFRYV